MARDLNPLDSAPVTEKWGHVFSFEQNIDTQPQVVFRPVALSSAFIMRKVDLICLQRRYYLMKYSEFYMKVMFGRKILLQFTFIKQWNTLMHCMCHFTRFAVGSQHFSFVFG